MYDFPLGRLLRSGLGWVGPEALRRALVFMVLLPFELPLFDVALDFAPATILATKEGAQSE